MGRKARLKKAAELAETAAQRLAIEARRREKRVPIIRWAVRLGVALLITVTLLYLGVLVNQRLVEASQESSQQQ